RLDERDDRAVAHGDRLADRAFAASGAFERARDLLGSGDEPDHPTGLGGHTFFRRLLLHHVSFVAPSPRPEGRRDPESASDRPFACPHAEQQQDRQDEHDDRPAGHGDAPAPQANPHATATPSNAAAFTPRRARSARNGTGSTSAARPCTPAAGPLRAARVDAAPARRAVVSASTVPAAIAVR